jgi:chaperonin GroEL
VEEGIVPGGGVALIRAQSLLADKTADAHDEQVGIDILRRALEAPIRQIAANAGADGSIVAAKVREGTGAFGYNAQTDEYEDLVKAGVIDPTKVVRTALQNAASIAGLLLTTEAVVVEKPEDTPVGPSMPDGGGMDGMY